MTLEAIGLTCGYGRDVIIGNISLKVETGDIVCLLGPNGAGKTTFFRTMLGFITPLGGSVRIDGKDISRFKASERAKRIAYVPQAGTIPFPFTVEEVVTMGRNAHSAGLRRPSSRDRAKALECMEELGIAHLGGKMYTRISGGERQMALIARALAQETSFLVMDEPTSNLDFGNQVRILEHLEVLRQKGLGIVMTTHSPDQALLCGTKAVAFNNGTKAVHGRPDRIITAPLMQKLYGVDVLIRGMDTGQGEISVCVPRLSYGQREYAAN